MKTKIENLSFIVLISFQFGMINKIVKKITELENESFEGWTQEEINGYLTACITIKKIVEQEIRTEKSHFTGSIEISDFYNHIVYVKSKYDTKRISSQQGSFLLYGIKDADKTKQAEFGKKQIDTTEYIIPYDKKKQILKELLKCGISQERLFPEIVNSAKVIKNKFGL